MKHLPVYTIDSFNWVKEDNTLYGVSNTLWDTLGYYQFPFPNNRKQFKLINPKTDGFRIFTFVTSFENTEGMLEYEFASEDGIKCRILIESVPVVNPAKIDDAYNWYKYIYEIEHRESASGKYLESLHMLSDLTKDEYYDRLLKDPEFAKKWYHDEMENIMLFRDEISYEESRPDILPD